MRECSVEGCPAPVAKTGLCSAHYQRLRRGHALLPVKQKQLSVDKRICRFETCERPGTSAGLCSGHYQQARAGKVLAPLQPREKVRLPCAGPSCARTAIAKGLCDGHYQQMRAGKALQPLQEIRSGCSVAGCSRPHEAHGLCTTHYSQRRQGREVRTCVREPSPVEVVAESGFTRVTLYGTSASGRKGEVVGYALVSVEDVPLVRTHRWRWGVGGYVVTKLNGKPTRMHRMLLSAPSHLEVDHIDGIRHNNQRSNLRLVDKKQQAENKKVRVESFTGFRSVFFDKRKKLYRVISTKNGVRRGHRHKHLADAVAEAEALRAEHMTHHNEERSRRVSDD